MAPAATLRRRLHWDTYHWWHEVVLIAAGYALYTLIRDLVPAHRSTAFHDARAVVRVERDLGIFHEVDVNRWLVHLHWLTTATDYWYATAHFAVTLSIAVWVIARHPRHARRLRIAWYSMNLYALIGFAFFPLAPPRFLDGHYRGLPNLGFVDTIMTFGIWGSVGKKGSADGASNPFAAMPSMHFGWALWCGVVLVVLATRWWVKALGVAYPLITLFVIIGTANHFLLDVAGGVAALGLGFATAAVLTRRRPAPAAPTATGGDPPRPARGARRPLGG